MSIAVSRLICDAATCLHNAGVDTPEHDAKLLLAQACHAELRDINKAMLMGDDLTQLLEIATKEAAKEAADNGQKNSLPSDNSVATSCANTVAYADNVLNIFQSMVNRRSQREPLQYIVGHAPFRYLDLHVGPGVFIPRPETETVVQAGLDWLDTQRRAIHKTCSKTDTGCSIDGINNSDNADNTDSCNQSDNTVDSRINKNTDNVSSVDASTGAPYIFRVVDLCAGSGAIGLSVVAETSDTEVWAVELSKRTAEWTRKNAHAVGKKHNISVDNEPPIWSSSTSPAARYHLTCGDATDPSTLADLDGTVDLVISNPPYIPESQVPEQPEVRDHDPQLALYGGSPDGMRIPEQIINRSAALLKHGGLLVMEHDISQGSALVNYAQTHGFNNSYTGNDWTNRPRYLVAQRA